jgi:hypothetical protein
VFIYRIIHVRCCYTAGGFLILIKRNSIAAVDLLDNIQQNIFSKIQAKNKYGYVLHLKTKKSSYKFNAL